jgi:two-component system phosphate regulon response regulator PhoB
MKTILLADDDEDVRNVIRMKLQHLPYVLLEVADGQAALAKVKSEQPDLLILDWSMPAMTGVEVMVALQQDPATAQIPVIMITGKDDHVDQARGLRLGAVGYLVKPFSPQELLQKVQAALGEQR